MRILFFTDVLGAGGKERRLTELMKSLESMQDISFELVLMHKEIHYKEVLDLGIDIHYILRKTKKDPLVLYKLFKHCKEYKPDILHCWDSMTAVYSVPVCKLLNIKLVNGMITNSLTRQSIFNNYWLRAKLTFPFSDYIVGNSYSGLKSYKAPGKKSMVIYNGFDFKRINSIMPADIIRKQLDIRTRYLIGMVASFSENKDYRTYFNSACSILNKRKDVTFLAIGNDTDSADLKKLIKDEFKEHFRLLGRKSGIESFINAMDICILSTFTEGISNSIMEYMAMEKPVIATIGGGTSEIVVDNITGFLINQSDPEDLAGKIEILLNDSELRRKMGIAGKQHVTTGFSIEKMITGYYDLYRLLLSDHRQNKN